jgi:hypothetical protein
VANQGSYFRYGIDSVVSVLLGNGDGTFQTAVNYTVGRNPVFVVVDDFNRDGRPDLAVANAGARIGSGLHGWRHIGVARQG